MGVKKKMKNDENKAAIVCIAWSLTFIIGMFMAAILSKPFGITLMIVSTLILIIYLRADGRIEAEKKRRRRYEEDCERRTREARHR